MVSDSVPIMLPAISGSLAMLSLPHSVDEPFRASYQAPHQAPDQA